MSKKFVWVLRVEVDARLVADGLDLGVNPSGILQQAFPYATPSSGIQATVVEAPPPDATAREQGYCCARARRRTELAARGVVCVVACGHGEPSFIDGSAV